jgi:hypothetical protein
MLTDESQIYLSAPETNSCSEPKTETLVLSGVDSSMIAGKLESIAQSSETSPTGYRHSSFAKRMQSLMKSGLIAGITPTSIAKKSNQATLDFVSSQLDGNDVGTLKADL